MNLTLVATNPPCSLITLPLFTSAGWLAKTILTEEGLCSQNDSEEEKLPPHTHAVVGDETVSQRRSNDVPNFVKSSLSAWIQVKVLI